jgi:hypothetical protein
MNANPRVPDGNSGARSKAECGTFILFSYHILHHQIARRMTDYRGTVSVRQASITGIALMAFGAWLVFVGTGVPHIAPAKGIPLWMVGLAGTMFGCGGGAMFVRYHYLGGSSSDAETAVTGPAWARALQFGLSLATLGTLCAMCTWVAFGPGPRSFNSGSTVPFLARTGEGAGRIGFGIAAALLAAVCLTLGVGGVRMLRGFRSGGAERK